MNEQTTGRRTHTIVTDRKKAKKKRERGSETKSAEEEMQMGMFLWAHRKDLG